jgi:hypothetical protein
MGHVDFIPGKHMDFIVVEAEDAGTLLDSTRRTMIDVGEELETYKADSSIKHRIETMYASLAEMEKIGVTSTGSRYRVFPWMGEFESRSAASQGFRVVYSVKVEGEIKKRSDLDKIENDIYDLMGDVESFLKRSFTRISDESGKTEAQIF